MVPGSTFKYGSSFCTNTLNPQAFIIAPMELTAIPFPKELQTPPVTMIKRVSCVLCLASFFLRELFSVPLVRAFFIQKLGNPQGVRSFVLIARSPPVCYSFLAQEQEQKFKDLAGSLAKKLKMKIMPSNGTQSSSIKRLRERELFIHHPDHKLSEVVFVMTTEYSPTKNPVLFPRLSSRTSHLSLQISWQPLAPVS